MTTTASSLLKQARLSRGLTQTLLARHADVTQPEVARAEAGRSDITTGKLDGFLAAADYSLYALPYERTPAAGYAIAIREALSRSPQRAYRILLQFNNDLAHSGAVERTVLCAAPAPSTDSQIFDALIAALCEYRLDELRAPVPDWVTEVPALDEPWFVDDFARRHVSESIEETPEPFLRRRLFVPRQEFETA